MRVAAVAAALPADPRPPTFGTDLWLAQPTVRSYIYLMTPSTEALLEQVASWPQQDQDEIAEYAREIEARRTGIYVLSDEEWADLQEGIAQADRDEFVPDEVVAAADKRHGL
jgi:hypothetical protein